MSQDQTVNLITEPTRGTINKFSPCIDKFALQIYTCIACFKRRQLPVKDN